ncbi:MAG: hypothetical protein CMJ85_10090 [Planctomycetes bacterium]|nr:hypothetical protein [Planctomycetota bacterium]
MRVVWMAPLLAVSLGCSSWQPPSVEQFFAGELDRAEQVFRVRVEQNAGDWILMANELATCLDAQGRYDEAWHWYYDAGRAMAVWDTSFGESFAAIAGREDTKDYKGDPYEQALNSIYTGLVAFARGEPDNARASFKEAMLRDADSTEDRFKSDLALSFYLAAWASRAMGSDEDAASFLNEARKARASAAGAGARDSATPECFADFARANVLIVCSIGRGPEKVPGGRTGELAVFRSAPGRAVAARVTVDGVAAGATETLCDVPFQAATRGGRVMDGVRKGKAVFKEVSRAAGVVMMRQGLLGRRHSKKTRDALVVAGAGALLVSALVSAEADVRCWRTLPDTIQAFAARIPPGRRRVRVDFVDAGGRPLAGYAREVEIDISADGTLVLHLRSLANQIPIPASRRR